MRIPFVSEASYPVREGNVVRPLVDGEAAFRRICAAIDEARVSVWVTVAFLWDRFRMPDNRGRVFDVLADAASRGIDVRMVCWRPDGLTESFKPTTFWGSDDQRALLASYADAIHVRWDRAARGYCQHQKSWIIDAGEDDAVCFVGGINMNPHSLVSPGHRGAPRQNHDVYVELSGPSCSDVHQNFVQRWNEASERSSDDGAWNMADDLPVPQARGSRRQCGNAIVHVQRTMPNGEQTILAQYVAAIDAARTSIYLEHQAITVDDVRKALERAATRGVEILALLPAECDDLEALRDIHNVTVTSIAGLGLDGRRNRVHVHSKLMLVDDAWGTIGSCNLHAASLFGNAELNVAFADPASVRALRTELFAEHLCEDVSLLEDRAALRRFREIASRNRRRRKAGNRMWQGIAVTRKGERFPQRKNPF